jgi:hypothetical protein
LIKPTSGGASIDGHEVGWDALKILDKIEEILTKWK